ncbi:MAG: solute carrier family 13 (sodium-dependent dicarboxylate transporter), member 2/3/5 [Rhodobacteraceae bacterium HLUCCA12]|nr:MAG: solute carrier family 13 (sodium-dependent dicarboxylate transporter), member 2/3/5 [Rhodobacteraceae bacterium HLUCCA12]
MPDHTPMMARSALAGLIAGLAVFSAALVIPPPAGLTVTGWQTLGLALVMAIWWSTEPVPIGITALLPMIVLPILGNGDIAAAAAPYGNPLVFLFLGGFMLAMAVQRWGLHRRLAWQVLRLVGTRPARLVLGVMVAVGFLSMWISNTAAALLMLPVALSVIAVTEGGDAPAQRRFALALLLGLAYAANIGGVGTLIGTPPNALLAGYLAESHGIDLSFALWAAVGVPLVAVFLPLGWWVLVRLVFPVAPELSSGGTADPVAALKPGRIGPAERRVALVFAAAALLWIARPLLNRLPVLEGLSDAGIALGCALALFLIPAGQERRFLLIWDEAKTIPWQVLLLFGGGLSLAAAMERSGLAEWIGAGFADLGAVPPIVLLLALSATVILLTELVSNTAVVAALLPITAAIAAGTGMDVVVLSAAVAMAASCAFMLPAATPPNALVFASGHVTVAMMMRAGVVMNVLSVGLVSLTAWVLGPLVAP